MSINDKVLELSEYSKIILSIVAKLGRISMTKVVFTSFCIKNCINSGDNIGRQKYEAFNIFLRHIGSQVKLKQNDFNNIYEAICILVKSKYLIFADNFVELSTMKRIEDSRLYAFSNLKIVFEEIKKMNESWFIEEIITNV